MMSLCLEIEKYKQWRTTHPIPAEYDGWWSGMYDAAFAFIASKKMDECSEDEISALLFLIANDTVDLIAERLGDTPEELLALAQASLNSNDPDSKWPLAVELGLLAERKKEAEPILLTFVYDDDEYLSRRVLLALGALKSDRVEVLAERAWETGHLYQRIAALSVLHEVSSERLPEFLKKAHEDGREYVLQKALKLEAA